MINQINSDKIVNYLKQFNVEEYYNWKIPLDKGHAKDIFTEDEIKSISDDSNFKENVKLKTLLKNKISIYFNSDDNQKLEKIFNWIVLEWGGIRGGKDNEDKLLILGKNSIAKGDLEFDRIASSSKILSFFDPEKFVIYDSRIIYSLNAIMLIEGASNIFFPMPSGRNSKMNAFDVEVLIRLKSKGNHYIRKGGKKLISNADKNLFIAKKDSYLALNNLVKEINDKIYENDSDKKKYPFYTEMLLFAIADTIIFDLIINSVEIKFVNE
jgi:hypothetical protein